MLGRLCWLRLALPIATALVFLEVLVDHSSKLVVILAYSWVLGDVFSTRNHLERSHVEVEF